MADEQLKAANEWTVKRKTVSDNSHANLMFVAFALAVGIGIALGIAYMIENRKKKGINILPMLQDPSLQHGFVHVDNPIDISKSISSV